MKTAHDNQEFADKTGSAGQPGIGHGKQHHKGGKHRHGICHTAVIGNLPAVHPVIHDTDAEEQGG